LENLVNGQLQPYGLGLRVSIDYEIDQSFWNKITKRPREKGGREHARNKTWLEKLRLTRRLSTSFLYKKETNSFYEFGEVGKEKMQKFCIFIYFF
jgi:hypothetical protein